ncbi:N-acetyl-gamma-glutamyl-phosphate reductase [uncultured Draconibacterium sp.]|uniref:N-acetyl-gamma-glutamyl-phosphate reductase n=1 Tax=uncultured Draconibacterium sp. TaxID=1573823 RepID=UPI0029C98D0C|nr:N-acetyl-gamma-glutamyl-phosphate reductase [uncultured Draconibacterium sp.]
MIKVGIIGGAGYTAGELLRILLNHPQAEIGFVQSTSNAGNLISDVHIDLLGETEIKFTDQMPFDEVDVIFLCMGHGKSIEFVENNSFPQYLKIIDLSHDFRLKREGNDFVYGLPELNREEIESAERIANPGCFATGIQLALLPLAANDLLQDEIHVQAITGSTGAGQKPTATSHFSWRSSNVSAYKIFEHQHEGEIIQSLTQLQPGFEKDFNFVPIRGNHTRGIFVACYTKFDGSREEANEIYKDYYADHPFVFVTDKNPGVKQVVNTNKGVIYLEKHGNKLVIISLTDNLIKGASGQAVQNMNLMFGLDEKTGLSLKPVAF